MPEEPDYVTVFDSTEFVDNNNLVGKAQRLPIWADKYRVSWYAKDQPPGYFAVGDGVAFVFGDEPTVPEREPMEIDFNSIDDAYFRWHDAVKTDDDSFMFILILPEGYTLSDPVPMPKEVKVFNGRLAIHWILSGDDEQKTKVEWRLKSTNFTLANEAKIITKFIQAARKTQQLPNLKKLRQLLETKFNLEELELFCDELGIEFENIPGGTRRKKSRELVTYMDRRDALKQLVATLIQERRNRINEDSLYD